MKVLLLNCYVFVFKIIEYLFSARPNYSGVGTRDGNPYPKNLPASGKEISAKSSRQVC